MKKLLLSLGALSAVVAPVAAVVACGSTNSKDPATKDTLSLEKAADKVVVTTSKLSQGDKTKYETLIDGASTTSELETIMKTVTTKINSANIKPKASTSKIKVSDSTIKMTAVEINGLDGKGILTVVSHLPKGVESVTASKTKDISNGDEIVLSVTYKEGFEGSSKVTYKATKSDFDVPITLAVEATPIKTKKTIAEIKEVITKIDAGDVSLAADGKKITLLDIAKALGLANTDAFGYSSGLDVSKIDVAIFDKWLNDHAVLDDSNPKGVKITFQLEIDYNNFNFVVILDTTA